jgi:hypothetical protein
MSTILSSTVGIDEEEAEDVNLGDIEVCINVSMMIN